VRFVAFGISAAKRHAASRILMTAPGKPIAAATGETIRVSSKA